jgi:tetratricopeptide (TPR) repeat protein
MQRRHSICTCMVLGLALDALSGRAQAQQFEPAEPPEATQPPATPDVTRSPAAWPHQPRATVLFAEGTRLFKQWRFEEAEGKYREALAHGRHPIIHLYLSRALEKQGRFVEAHEALQQALRKGGRPLLPEDVQVAKNLQRSLESRLAQIEVHCDEPRAEVFLDGEPWFVAPGRLRRTIAAGQHVLAVQKPGYFRVTEPITLAAGKQRRVALRMTADVVHVERRWHTWQPWSVASTGLAMTLAGGWLLREARIDYAAIRRELDLCEATFSCKPVSARWLARAKWKEGIGTGTLIAGVSAMAGGLVGVLLNLPSSKRSEPARGLEDLDITPMISSDAYGISAQIRF